MLMAREGTGAAAVIREDRILLTELARLNTAVPELAIRMMDGALSTEEQIAFGRWLLSMAEAIMQRAERSQAFVLDGQVLLETGLAAIAGPTISDG